MSKISVLAVLTFVFEISTANWCGLQSCNGDEHVDCILGEPGSWGKNCPDNKSMLDMRDVQHIILARQNEYRNKIAGGLEDGFLPAKRMGTLVWNVTLANLARKNVRRCKSMYDECRNTPEYDFVGQNIASKRYKRSLNRKNIDVILELIDSWYNKIIQATINGIGSYPDIEEIFHFAQLLREYASRVGCAALKMTEGSDEVMLFTCNYDKGVYVDRPFYEEGPIASECSATNPIYKNLCFTDEVYNINEF